MASEREVEVLDDPVPAKREGVKMRLAPRVRARRAVFVFMMGWSG
jgi:hypothetical protein